MASERVKGIRCPYCKKVIAAEVIDSRPIINGRIRRRYCENCNTRFNTVERVLAEEEMGKIERG